MNFDDGQITNDEEQNYDFQLDQNDAIVILDDINPLPRSVVRRTPFSLLDGEWRFALDLENRGLAENWHVEHDYESNGDFSRFD